MTKKRKLQETQAFAGTFIQQKHELKLCIPIQLYKTGRRILTTLVPNFNHLHMWVYVIMRHQLLSSLALHYSRKVHDQSLRRHMLISKIVSQDFGIIIVINWNQMQQK